MFAAFPQHRLLYSRAHNTPKSAGQRPPGAFCAQKRTRITTFYAICRLAPGWVAAAEPPLLTHCKSKPPRGQKYASPQGRTACFYGPLCRRPQLPQFFLAKPCKSKMNFSFAISCRRGLPPKHICKRSDGRKAFVGSFATNHIQLWSTHRSSSIIHRLIL